MIVCSWVCGTGRSTPVSAAAGALVSQPIFCHDLSRFMCYSAGQGAVSCLMDGLERINKSDGVYVVGWRSFYTDYMVHF